MTTTEIFMKMVYWLVDNTEMRNPTAVARKAGINAANVTKIKTGKSKSVKYETMVKLNNAFGNRFNPEWMRGESDVMLLVDLSPDTTTIVTPKDVPSQAHIDPTTQLIAAKDEIIAILRSQLADKDALIESKERYINILQQQILNLHNSKQ